MQAPIAGSPTNVKNTKISRIDSHPQTWQYTWTFSIVGSHAKDRIRPLQLVPTTILEPSYYAMTQQRRHPIQWYTMLPTSASPVGESVAVFWCSSPGPRTGEAASSGGSALLPGRRHYVGRQWWPTERDPGRSFLISVNSLVTLSLGLGFLWLTSSIRDWISFVLSFLFLSFSLSPYTLFLLSSFLFSIVA